MDYKFTLNLPNTKFSMKGNLPNSEHYILKFWKKINIYNSQDNNAPLFVLNDGPPYANGDIHIGHAFNKILKDIVVKFKMLSGYNVNFIPCWDCHGLPIELNVERMNKDKFNIVSNKEFRRLCQIYAGEQINIQKKSFMRLGLQTDWKNFYKTMDKNFELSIVDSFKKMLHNKYIYSGYRPVYWCFDCSSALAEAEIEYENKSSDSIYVFFKLFDHSFLNVNLLSVGFVVWTTTPWTLPFNEAVAIKSNINYVLIEFNKIGYIFCKNLLKDICKLLGFKNYNILLQFKGDILLNSVLLHPFYNKKINTINSIHVKDDSGTGCVHIAPGYGYDDYKVACKYNLSVKNGINEKGYFNNNILLFSDLYITIANKKVIKLLQVNSKIFIHNIIFHRYPYCWRHKTFLIFRTTKQWFVKIDHNSLRKKVLDNVLNSITWIPEIGKHKMKSMFNDRPDWCISRQRLWGVPFILFIGKNGKLHPNTLSILKESLVFIKKYGVNFWYNFDVFKLFSVDKNNYDKSLDVLDVWFDSSAVYKYILDVYKYKLPLDLCIEGTDQYRGWFQVSLINSIANYSTPPYKTIVTHGFILDKFGKKMSKSLNNVISPNDVVNKYGADILRLWVSSVNYQCDVNISKEILLRVSEAYRKIRNTFRFLLSNLYDFNPKFFLCKKLDLLDIDKWILSRFLMLNRNILNDYDNYNFNLVYRNIYDFCVDDLGSKYLDLIKDRLYTARANSFLRRSSQFILFYISYNLVKLISPILSFTAEEVWSYLPIKDIDSVFLSKFNIKFIISKQFTLFSIYRSILWDKVFILRVYLNKLIEEYRKKNIFGTSLDVELNMYCNIYWYDLLSNVKSELHLFFLVSKVNLFLIFKTDNNFLRTDICGIFLNLKKVLYIKCERCWHRAIKIIENKISSIDICNRCILNLYYNEEIRFFV